jgi:hypothetical protein
MTDLYQKVREGHRSDLLERGRFFTSLLATRQEPATEEEETYLE